LVPAKYIFLNRSLQKFLFLKIVPGGTILKNKKFCRDQKQFFFLQGPKLKQGIFAGTSTIFKPKLNDERRNSYHQWLTAF